MLPRLQAEEMLAGAHVAALGSGNMKPTDAREAYANLKRSAGVKRARRASTPADVAAMGFGVQVVPKASKG